MKIYSYDFFIYDLVELVLDFRQSRFGSNSAFTLPSTVLSLLLLQVILYNNTLQFTVVKLKYTTVFITVYQFTIVNVCFS